MDVKYQHVTVNGINYCLENINLENGTADLKQSMGIYKDSVLFITTNDDDANSGFAAGKNYIWAHGKLFCGSNSGGSKQTVEGSITIDMTDQQNIDISIDGLDDTKATGIYDFVGTCTLNSSGTTLGTEDFALKLRVENIEDTLGTIQILDNFSVLLAGCLCIEQTNPTIEELFAGLSSKAFRTYTDNTWSDWNFGLVHKIAFTGDYNDLTNTPTDFTGATALSGGTNGLVPAPTSNDYAKFLKGDGTWAEIDGGKIYSTLGKDYSTTPTTYTFTNLDNITNSGVYQVVVTPSGSPLVNFSCILQVETTRNAGRWVSQKLYTLDSQISIGYMPTSGALSRSGNLQGGTPVWGGWSESNILDITFSGADGTNAGKNGLVPQPAASANTQYLKGDGTWSFVDSASITGSGIALYDSNDNMTLTPSSLTFNYYNAPVCEISRQSITFGTANSTSKVKITPTSGLTVGSDNSSYQVNINPQNSGITIGSGTGVYNSTKIGDGLSGIRLSDGYGNDVVRITNNEIFTTGSGSINIYNTGAITISGENSLTIIKDGITISGSGEVGIYNTGGIYCSGSGALYLNNKNIYIAPNGSSYISITDSGMSFNNGSKIFIDGGSVSLFSGSNINVSVIPGVSGSSVVLNDNGIQFGDSNNNIGLRPVRPSNDAFSIMKNNSTGADIGATGLTFYQNSYLGGIPLVQLRGTINNQVCQMSTLGVKAVGTLTSDTIEIGLDDNYKPQLVIGTQNMLTNNQINAEYVSFTGLSSDKVNEIKQMLGIQ